MSQEYLDVYMEMKLEGLFYVDDIAIIGYLGQQHDRCTDPCKDRYNGVVHWECSCRCPIPVLPDPWEPCFYLLDYICYLIKLKKYMLIWHVTPCNTLLWYEMKWVAVPSKISPITLLFTVDKMVHQNYEVEIISVFYLRNFLSVYFWHLQRIWYPKISYSFFLSVWKFDVHDFVLNKCVRLLFMGKCEATIHVASIG